MHHHVHHRQGCGVCRQRVRSQPCVYMCGGGCSPGVVHKQNENKLLGAVGGGSLIRRKERGRGGGGWNDGRGRPGGYAAGHERT